MRKFFAVEVDNLDTKTWWWLELDPPAVKKDPSIEDEVFKKRYRRTAPVPMRVMRGLNCPDYGCSALLMDIVTARVVEALTRVGCTGFTTTPVTVRGRTGQVLRDGVFWIQYSGSRTTVDETRGYMRRLMPGIAPPMDDEAAARAEAGIWLDDSEWEELDFFRPSNAAVTLVSEKAAKVLKGLRLKGARVIPAKDIGLHENLKCVAFRRLAGLAKAPGPGTTRKKRAGVRTAVKTTTRGKRKTR